MKIIRDSVTLNEEQAKQFSEEDYIIDELDRLMSDLPSESNTKKRSRASFGSKNQSNHNSKNSGIAKNNSNAGFNAR